MKPETEKTLLHCLFIILVTFIPYQQVVNHRFIEYDDALYTFGNTYIIKGLTWDSLVWAFTNTETANWHPLTWITHLIDRELFGPHAGGYFLMNLAWHTITACLCYMALFKTTKQRFFALSVAIIFALHPANVENVAWNSERKSLVEAFFWFLGIMAYIDFLETRRFKFYGIVFISHLLGLMAKPMQVTFPCALVLIHLLHLISSSGGLSSTWQSYRTAIFASLKLVWPLLIVTAYFCVVTASAQNIAMSTLDMLPISARTINVFLSYHRYVLMYFSPGDLAPFYPLDRADLQPASIILPLLLLGSVTLLVLLLFKKHPIFLLGWFWFLGTMVPAVGIVQVGNQSHADRYLYIPMIGLSFVFPELFGMLRSCTTKRLNMMQAGWVTATALSLGLATFVQAGFWKNGVTLFRHSLQVTGDCVTAVNCLGSAYMRNERFEEAIAFLESKIVVARKPSNIANFYSTKSQAHLALNQYESAIDSVTQSIAHGRNDSLNQIILAKAYLHLGKKDLADKAMIACKQLLVAVNPSRLSDIQIYEAIRIHDLTKENSPNPAP